MITEAVANARQTCRRVQRFGRPSPRFCSDSDQIPIALCLVVDGGSVVLSLLQNAMKQITNSWTLPCTPDVYWDLYLNADYSRALYLDALGFVSYRAAQRRKTRASCGFNPS